MLLTATMDSHNFFVFRRRKPTKILADCSGAAMPRQDPRLGGSCSSPGFWLTAADDERRSSVFNDQAVPLVYGLLLVSLALIGQRGNGDGLRCCVEYAKRRTDEEVGLT